MKLTFLGGADEVGASCTLVEVAGRRLVIDCGVRIGADDPLPWLQPIADAGGADAIIVTHAHLDHIGALPLLVQTNDARLYMTPPTFEIMRVMLNDSLKIMKYELEREGEIPLYPRAAVEVLLARSHEVEWHQTHDLFGGDVRITFLPAGHILGASSVLIESDEGSVLMGGDVSADGQLTCPGFDWSSVRKVRPDALVCESTYGGRMHASRAGEERRLIAQAREVIDRGGRLLIPAFALGRAQELILILSRAFEDGDLNPVPVFVDGLVRTVCTAYWHHANYGTTWFTRRARTMGEPFFNHHAIMPVRTREMREDITNIAPAIYISSSGMLTGGPSPFYASKLADDRRSHIAITGYQDEESPGRAIQKVAKQGGGRLRLQGEWVNLKCSVGTYGLSAHADTNQLVSAITGAQPRQVFLVHGDGNARSQLADALTRVGLKRVDRPKLGESYLIEAKRKRSTKRKPQSPPQPNTHNDNEAIVRQRALLFEDLPGLAQKLLERDKNNRAYSVRQVIEEWGDPVSAQDPHERQRVAALFKRKDSPFKGKKGRYRLRFDKGRVVGLDEGPRTKPGNTKAVGTPKLNQAEATQRVHEVLGESGYGLYKVGTYPAFSLIKLYFHFPGPAATAHAKEIEALWAETGWRFELNQAPHHQALCKVAHAAFPDNIELKGQPALHLDKGVVSVTLAGDCKVPADFEARRQAFAALTGFDLRVDGVRSDHNSGRAGKKRLASNEAMEVVRQALSGVDSFLKVGAKQGRLVLRFVTPEIAQRHEDILDEITASTGWPIEIYPQANQEVLKRWVHQHLPHGMRGTKVSVYPERNLLAIRLSQAMKDQHLEAFKLTLQNLTGGWDITAGVQS